MSKRNTVLLKVTGIISAILATVFVVAAVMLIFDIMGFRDLYIATAKQIGYLKAGESTSAAISMAIFDSVIGLFINAYSASVYFKLSKSKAIIIGGSKIVLYAAILQAIMIVSLLPGIMGIIVSVMISGEEKAIINRPRPAGEEGMDVVKQQISILRMQKERGEITEDQYDRALSAIVDKVAEAKQRENSNKN